MDNIIVSVIIPAFNSQEYIEECLNSVIDQTLKEIEIICIDDCSTDETKKIFDIFAQKDKRIRVVSNIDNKGQGECRNIGLDMAKGEYVYFLDSDDYLLSKDALEILWNEVTDSNVDMVCFNSQSLIEIENLSSKFEFEPKRNNKYDHIMGGIESYIKFRENDDYFSPTWLYFYSMRFLKEQNLRFISKIASEDISFTFEAHKKSKSVKVIDSVLHCYRIRDNSQTHSKNKVYKVKSAETNVRYLLKNLFVEDTDGEVEYAYGLEFNLECGLWRSRYSDCSYEEKREYLSSIKKGIIADLFYSKVLQGYNFLLPENIIDELSGRKVWLYGAGMYGREYYRFLKRIGIDIEGVIVSKQDGSVLYGYKPTEITQWVCSEGDIVVPAVSDKYRDDILKVLSQYTGIEIFEMENYRALTFDIL